MKPNLINLSWPQTVVIGKMIIGLSLYSNTKQCFLAENLSDENRTPVNLKTFNALFNRGIIELVKINAPHWDWEAYKLVSFFENIDFLNF